MHWYRVVGSCIDAFLERSGGSMSKQKTVSLVLGSGGARGLSHIGIIKWLEEHDYHIESISGCSIGALIGGIYAAGKLDDFEQWSRSITKMDILTLLDLSWNRSGLVKGDKLINTLTELVGDLKIEDLPIKYTAVASDIANEKEVWLNSGKLFDAIRASISLPFFFTPFSYNGRELMDGGILNPIPVAPTFCDGTDLTIAVNLVGKVLETKRTPVVTDLDNALGSPISDKVAGFVNRFKGSPEEPIGKDVGVFEIANQAFDAMQNTIFRHKQATYPADYLIEIPRNACGMLEFNRASEMIDLGYNSMCESLGSAT